MLTRSTTRLRKRNDGTASKLALHLTQLQQVSKTENECAWFYECSFESEVQIKFHLNYEK